jgi:hypothetical protein
MNLLQDYMKTKALYLMEEFGYQEQELTNVFAKYVDNIYVQIYIGDNTIQYCLENKEWKTCSLYELSQLLHYQKYGITNLKPNLEVRLMCSRSRYCISAVTSNIPKDKLKEFARVWGGLESNIQTYENNLFLGNVNSKDLQPCLDAIHNAFFKEYSYMYFRVEHLFGECPEPFSFSRELTLSN